MSVLDLDDVKKQLNITGSTHDAELQVFIDAAEAVIAERCGPLAPTEVTRRVLGGSVIVLPDAPVVSLTGVTAADSGDLALDEVYLDQATGIVSYVASSSFTARYYDVTYMAGREDVPEDLLMAVKELVQHLWRSQRGPMVQQALDAPTGAGYLLPNRVVALLAPHMIHSVA